MQFNEAVVSLDRSLLLWKVGRWKILKEC